LHKIIYVLTAITLLPLFGHCQQYKKDKKQAEEAYASGDFFAAIELYKKSYTEFESLDIDDFKVNYICKIADCYRQACDYKQVKAWYRKAIKCECMDSNTAKGYIAEADSNLKKDTVLKFIKYAPCDDCNEGYYVIKGKNYPSIPPSKDTCHFSLAIIKSKENDTVMHTDSATLIRSGSCTYMLDLPKSAKLVRYWLFKSDSSRKKVRSLYYRQVYKKEEKYFGMDVTYIPSGIYLFYIYSDYARQEYILHLK